MKLFFCLGAFSFFFFSCAYNKSELPTPEEGEEQPVITYTNYVKSMIDSNHCLECHVSGGTASFRNYTTYSGIRDVAISGELRRRAIDGVTPTMPLGYPELSQPIKDTLLLWINQGAQE